MKIFVLLEHSHHEIMNADKAFVRAEQVQEYLKSAPGTYCEDEIELVLPEEHTLTVHDLIKLHTQYENDLEELELSFDGIPETDELYKKRVAEKKELKKKFEEFKRRKVHVLEGGG